MTFDERSFLLRDGRTCVLRSASREDALVLLQYLKTVAGQTRFLLREPEEITLTLEQEEAFLDRIAQAEREVMIIALVDGAHAGNCSISCVGAAQRYAHRCSVGIALDRAYWGLGIGTRMMQEALQTAKGCGYEQAELEVVTENRRAIRLYEKLGFETVARLAHNMKYRDGSYADVFMMMKKLG